MRICVFEDAACSGLEPLTLTRPAFDLRCGAATLLERQVRRFAARRKSAPWCGRSWPTFAVLTHPEMAVNDRAWLRRGPRRSSTPAGCRATAIRSLADGPGVGVVDDQHRLRRAAGREAVEASAGNAGLAPGGVEADAAAPPGRRRPDRLSVGPGRAQRRGAAPGLPRTGTPATSRRPFPPASPSSARPSRCASTRRPASSRWSCSTPPRARC